METITVENNRIRVTIPLGVWESFGERAKRLERTETLPSGETRHHGAESIQRGLVLSDAMARIGNTSEAEILARTPISESEVMSLTKELLIERYLSEHCPHDADEIMHRYAAGRRMSQRHQAILDDAMSYASVVLTPAVEAEERETAFEGWCEMSESALARRLKELQFRLSADPQARDEAVEGARKALEARHAVELRYRRRFADTAPDWQIEIIGEMPIQVGMCRMQAVA